MKTHLGNMLAGVWLAATAKTMFVAALHPDTLGMICIALIGLIWGVTRVEGET